MPEIPQRQTLLNCEHPVEGSLVFSREGDHVTVRCRWPYDLKEDLWININDHYCYPDFLAGVEKLLAGAESKIQGKLGYLVLRPRDDETFWLELWQTHGQSFLQYLPLQLLAHYS